MSERSNQRLLQSTPAEPNPPGSREPVAGWHVGDAVEKYTGDYCAEGTVLSAYQLPTGTWRYDIGLTRITKGMIIHIFNGANLRSAPLPSPSEGAGDLAWWRKKACDLSVENTLLRGDIITLGGEIADLKERIEDLEYAPGGPKDYNKSRTRATATGGRDNG